MWFFINSINSGQCYAGSGEKWGNLTKNARKVGCFGEKRGKIASRRPLRASRGRKTGEKPKKDARTRAAVGMEETCGGDRRAKREVRR